MVVHQNITNLAGYFHFLNVRKIPYVIVFDERIAAGVHDTVEAGVPAFCEGVFSIFCNRLHGSLHVEQGLCQIGNTC